MTPPLGKIPAAFAAAVLLQGCIQYSDTMNRPQVSTLPADSGSAALQDGIAGNTYTPVEAANARMDGVHPKIAYFYEKLCEGTTPEDPPCNPSDGVVVYQDKDVALVSTDGYPAYIGTGGYHYFLLDLKGKSGDSLFSFLGGHKSVKRKGKAITISYEINTYGDSRSPNRKKTINLNKKPRAVHFCEQLGC